jgi:pantoate--beta-alanine ligase
MEIAESVAQARSRFSALPRPLGFVPTMGALHAGHLALVAAARKDCAAVGVSLFVNPHQFGAGEDFERYPRDASGDREKLARAGVDVLFVPPTAAMYPPGFDTWIEVGAVSRPYEGAARPAHFRGVATVVAKLLNVVCPDVLYLGQKDAQQTAVLRAMIADLAVPVTVDVVPTVREADGLALSSRNAYLTPQQRAQAPSLHRALEALRDALRDGAGREGAIAAARSILAGDAAIDYFDAVDPLTFEPVDRPDREALAIGAARFGATRLIDNVPIPARP